MHEAAITADANTASATQGFRRAVPASDWHKSTCIGQILALSRPFKSSTGVGVGREVEEGCCNSTLGSHNQHTAPFASAEEFGVGIPSFPSLCAAERDAWLKINIGERQVVTRERGRGIYSELGAMPQRQAVATGRDVHR